MKENISLNCQELLTRSILIDIKNNFVDIKIDLLNKSIALRQEQSTSIEAENLLDGTFLEIIDELDKQIIMIDKAIKSRECSETKFDNTGLVTILKMLAMILSF